MRITPDNFMLLPSLICAVAAYVAYMAAGFIAGERVRGALLKFARASYYVSLGLVGYAALYLLQQLLSCHRYDIAYAYYNSGPSDALIYKVSSLWAGQEGSLLVWAVMAGLIGVAFVRSRERTPAFQMAFWCLVQMFFLVILLIQDPFAPLKDFQAGVIGGGLNPLLKNPWMAFHPPVIFLGYALLSVPAAFAVQALADGDGSKWARRCMPWALAGWVSLTLGLVLGMIWSYQVLGWGGYWGWDPVENASLVPWLVSTALLHGLVLHRYRERMSRANLALALFTFLTVIYATFITRSGLLGEEVSVHAFSDVKSKHWLIGFTIFFVVACLGLLVARMSAIRSAKRPMGAYSRDLGVGIGVIVIALFAAFVVVGVSATTFFGVLLKPSLYTNMSILPAIAVLGLIGLAPLVKWKKEGEESCAGAFLFNAVAAAVMLALVGAVGAALLKVGAERAGWHIRPGMLTQLFLFQIVLLVISSMFALGVSVWAGFKSSFMRSGAYIAHAGIALLVLGVIVSANGVSRTHAVAENGPAREVLGYQLSYKGLKSLGGNKGAMLIDVKRGVSEFSAPLMFEQKGGEMVRKPFIRSSALGDLYMSAYVESPSITPTLSITENKVVSSPARIPGSDSKVEVIGMAVESQMAKLQYAAPGQTPQEFVVGKDHPAQIDGYEFEFRRLVNLDIGKSAMQTAGVELSVMGHGLSERAIVNISTKPFIYLVWIGSLLLALGGGIAVLRRLREKPKPADGILPDSD